MMVARWGEGPANHITFLKFNSKGLFAGLFLGVMFAKGQETTNHLGTLPTHPATLTTRNRLQTHKHESCYGCHPGPWIWGPAIPPFRNHFLRIHKISNSFQGFPAIVLRIWWVVCSIVEATCSWTTKGGVAFLGWEFTAGVLLVYYCLDCQLRRCYGYRDPMRTVGNGRNHGSFLSGKSEGWDPESAGKDLFKSSIPSPKLRYSLKMGHPKRS